ncbi:MAG: MazG nucleotide pyrophosphohydrolase domain-containing protein, partial [Candidatus Binatia bacterium]
DWPDAAAVTEKVHEELAEIEEALRSGDPGRIEHEIGDCLFALTSLARKRGLSAEIALGRALERFRTRFSHVERRLEELGKDVHAVSLEEMEALWQEAK